MSQPRELSLIFTRDFTQWLNQMLRDEYVLNFPKIWGKGLEDQIVHYTGRATELYRYADDQRELGAYMSRKDLNDNIFSEDTHQQFSEDVKRLRELIAINPKEIADDRNYYQEIFEIFARVYPFYTLSVFLPGPWREQFLAVHGEAGNEVLERVFKSRELSEGVAKLCGDFLLFWLGSKMELFGYPVDYFKLLSVEEVKKFVNEKVLPDKQVLAQRSKGYVYIGGEIIPTVDFTGFLKDRNLFIADDINKADGIISGTVACSGVLITGQVKTIFNSRESASFPDGAILVTPMTSPEYLFAMKKAKAIITDEGGLACHAAIVSRELGIPCVIGTKIATKIFKDGDMVEVDATKGIIKKIS